MTTSHCETEFRWVKHTVEVLGQPNPVLQTRTVTSGFSELDGAYSHATPWRDVPVLTEEEAAKLDAPKPPKSHEVNEQAWVAAAMIGAAVLVVLVIVIARSMAG